MLVAMHQIDHNRRIETHHTAGSRKFSYTVAELTHIDASSHTKCNPQPAVVCPKQFVALRASRPDGPERIGSVTATATLAASVSSTIVAADKWIMMSPSVEAQTGQTLAFVWRALDEPKAAPDANDTFAVSL